MLNYWNQAVARITDRTASQQLLNSIYNSSVFGILGPKHIGITTLAFQGHVTLSPELSIAHKPFLFRFLGQFFGKTHRLYPLTDRRQTDTT